jgi:hypothetical protein
VKYTQWVLAQIADHRPGVTEMPGPSVQSLVDALRVVRGASNVGQLFGCAVSNIEPEGMPSIDAAVLAALVEWREHFADDPVSLLALEQAGRAANAPELYVAKRAPLRCDPLGTRDKLAREWTARLAALDDAIAGARRLALEAVHCVGSGEVTFGAPDADALYAFALRFETGERDAFPRELAALVSTANGIFVDGDPLLAPVSDWTWDDDGLCIGCGGYVQGALTIAISKKQGLVDAPVLDRDDDGETRARHANLGAFIDALLGR